MLRERVMIWYEVKIKSRPDLEAWFRSHGIDEHGVVYQPAAEYENEDYVHCLAVRDGAEVVVYKGHYFMSVDWLARHFDRAKAAEKFSKLNRDGLKMVKNIAAQGDVICINL